MLHPSCTMNTPPPHNFSHSPVEEVYCSCELNQGKNLALSVRSPYPGWSRIREDYSTLIASIPDPNHVSGCLLRYTDWFPSVRVIPSHDSFKRQITDQVQTRKMSETELELAFRSSLSGSMVRIRSVYGNLERSGWTLVFTLMIDPGSCHFSSSKDILAWFDAAHAEIHVLFDQMVPPEITDEVR